MDSLAVQFGSMVSLRSKHTCQYFCYDDSRQLVATANGSPPSIRSGRQADQPTQGNRRNIAFNQFRIVSCTPKDTRTGMQLNSKVFFVNRQANLLFSQGQYLACLGNGELKFDKPSLDEGMNSMLFKTSTWIVQEAQQSINLNSSNKRQLIVYDDVVLKSVYGNMLGCDESFNVTANYTVVNKQCTWNIMKASVPFIPDWVYQRPTIAKHMQLSSDGLGLSKGEQGRRDDKKLLSSFSLQAQEWYLVEDILDIMLGFEGVYVKKRGQGRSLNFVIEPYLESASCDPSLYQLCQKIFSLPLNYLVVENYIAVNNIENGTVCQAFTGALRTLIKEYKMMVVQLDEEVKNGLTLQKMWYYVQPSCKIMESLVELTRHANGLRGGPLLSCIFTMLNSTTDDQVKGIYCFLFNRALSVYVQLLEKWIYEGVISDKYEQFMVFEQRDIRKDNRQFNYWDDRFTLRRELVPVFLQKDSDIILMTGKYLNVISECNIKILHPNKGELHTVLNRCMELQDFTEPLQNAYNWANDQLNNLIKEKGLMGLLKSMKGFFFMEYGDFFVHFLDAAEKYLSQTRNRHVSIEKLESLLELCVKTSTASSDPFNEDVSCRIENFTIFEQIQRIKSLQPRKFNFDSSGEKPLGATSSSKYLDFFTLEFKVEFPLNLIINRKVLTKYQVLFRHLFWCKYIERQLNQTWYVLQSTKKTPLSCYMHAYGLNQRMLHYCKNIVYNLSYEVIEHNWIKLTENLKKVRRFEDVIQFHEEFLDTCLKESLLMNDSLLKIVVVELGNSCQGFFSIKTYIESLNTDRPQTYESSKMEEAFTKQTTLQKRNRKQAEQLAAISTLMEAKNFSHFVKGFVVCFDKALKRLLEEIYRLISKQDGHLANLLTRLDSQGFYTQRLKIALSSQMILEK